MSMFRMLGVLLCLIQTGLLFGQTATPPPGGDGSSGNPYQIATLENLYWLSISDSVWDKDFVQTADINAAATETWDNDSGFTPIGNSSTKFSGSYDGGGYEIDSLYINRVTDDIGLFGYTNNAVISDLGMTSVNFSGMTYVGAIVGEAGGTTDIQRCHSSGIAGAGTATAGGIVGYVQSSASVSRCRTSCDVVGGNTCGGFVGSNAGTVSDCYSHGSVDGGSSIGGFVGYSGGTTVRCYSTGTIVAAGGTGFCGNSFGGTISDVFWDKTSSGENSDSYATGKTTAEMKDVATFTNTATSGLSNPWDFVGDPNNDAVSNDYWHIDSTVYNAGYPYLTWEVKTVPMVTTGPINTLTDSSAGSGGEVTSDGGAAVTARGVCWNNGGSPTTSDNVTSDSSGTGTFSSLMTGLSANMVYYYRAYATNSEGTSYGAADSFQTMPAQAAPAGAGTEGDPYQIASLENLSWLIQHSGEWDKYYIQTADINAAATATWDSDSGFTPLGNSSTKFTGSYDGDGNVIDSLVIDRTTDNIGLFGYVNGGVIENVGVTDADITGGTYVGAVAGYFSGTASMTQCHSSGIVTGSVGAIGGVVGYNLGFSSVERCHTSCDVTGGNTSGGFVGSNEAAVSDCYCTGDVDGANSVGGFSGYTDGSLDRCYSAGAVTATGAVGGFTAYNYGTVADCFWDTTVAGNLPTHAGQRKSTAAMQAVATFTDSDSSGLSAAWDFAGDPFDDAASSDFWNIDSSYNSGYPYLSWEIVTAPMVTTGPVNTLTDSSAGSGGEVTSDGGAAVTARGVCWNTGGTPTTSDNVTSDSSGTGTFSSLMTGLAANTVYYYRAYATNSEGISYGAADSFQTMPAQAVPVGAGTEGDPYQIATLENLSWLMQHSDEWDAYFEQTADISAAATAGWDLDSGFAPIGNTTTLFTGSYDGGGYHIDSLHIIRNAVNYIGLFGYTSGATISDLGVTNVTVGGNMYVGGISGYLAGSTNMTRCHSTGTVIGYGAVIGGITGYNNTSSSISLCRTSCTVDGWNTTGGLVGANYATIADCYATGTVDGNSSVGGFAGYTGGTLNNCYSIGAVTYSSSGGGFAGNNSGDVTTNCFWDEDSSGQSASTAGTGKSAAQMRDAATFTDLNTGGLDASWDFVGNPSDDAGLNSYWNIDSTVNDGYPYFAFTDGSDQTVPVITSAAADTATEEQLFTYVGTATDDDSDPVISFSGLPGWLAAGGDTVSGTPDDGDSTTTFSVIADDGILADTQVVTLTVIAVNDVPVITSAAADTATEDVAFLYEMTASDVDGTPTLSAEGLPSWLSVAGETVSGTPAEGDGDTVFTVIADDGELADTLLVSLTVNAVNDAPVAGSGGCLDFDGINDYVTFGSAASLRPNVFTLEYWVNPGDQSASYARVTSYGGDEFETAFNNSGRLAYYGDTWRTVVTLDKYTWHHVAYAYNGSRMTVYVNGDSVYTNTESISLPSAGSLYLGERASFGGEEFGGEIDEVRLWNDVRTGEEVRGNMHVKLAGNEPGLAGYWDMDEEAGLTVHDLTANGNHGTMVNMSAGSDWNKSDAWRYREIAEEETLYVTCGYDVEGDSLDIHTMLPAGNGAAAVAGENLVMYVPDADFNGADTFSYSVGDGEYVDSFRIAVMVTPVNDPPEITNSPADTATEEQELVFVAQVTDPDDTPVISFGVLPGWLAQKGDTLYGTPDDPVSDTLFWVFADDGEAKDSLRVDVTVVPVNDAPVITSAPDTDAEANRPYRATTTVTDADGDAAKTTFGLITAPGGMTVDDSTGEISWLPTASQTGDTVVRLVVNDGDGAADTLTYTLTVAAATYAWEVVSDTGTYLFDAVGVALRITSLTGADSVTAEVFADSFPPDLPSNNPVKRFFEIKAGSGISAFEAVVTFTYAQADFDASDITDETSLYASRWDGGEWVPFGSIADTLNNAVTVTTTEFSLWALGGTGASVPVELASFTGQAAGSAVALAWTTVSEQGNLGFNVLRSDASDGVYIAVNDRLIGAAGTDGGSYAFTDAAGAGTWYYVLEQVDVNGVRTLSDPVMVTVAPAGLEDMVTLINRIPAGGELLSLSGTPVQTGAPQPGVYLVKLGDNYLKVIITK